MRKRARPVGTRREHGRGHPRRGRGKGEHDQTRRGDTADRAADLIARKRENMKNGDKPSHEKNRALGAQAYDIIRTSTSYS